MTSEDPTASNNNNSPGIAPDIPLTPPDGIIMLNGTGWILDGRYVNNASGIILFDNPDEKFDLDIKDPRFQACVETAHALKKEYPLAGLNPENPQDHAKILSYEEAITQALVAKIHQQYGDYNSKVEKIELQQEPIQKLEEQIETRLTQPINSKIRKRLLHWLHKLQTRDNALSDKWNNDPSLHNDDNRASAAGEGIGIPPSMGEFKKGELICRQFAPLASCFSTEAGLNNLYTAGFLNSFEPNHTANGLRYGGGGGHAFVVSKLTGSVIDATALASAAYNKNITNLPVEDFISGATMITLDAKGIISTYGTGEGLQANMRGTKLHDLELAWKAYSGGKLNLPYSSSDASELFAVKNAVAKLRQDDPAIFDKNQNIGQVDNGLQANINALATDLDVRHQQLIPEYNWSGILKKLASSINVIDTQFDNKKLTVNQTNEKIHALVSHDQHIVEQWSVRPPKTPALPVHNSTTPKRL